MFSINGYKKGRKLIFSGILLLSIIVVLCIGVTDLSPVISNNNDNTLSIQEGSGIPAAVSSEGGGQRGGTNTQSQVQAGDPKNKTQAGADNNSTDSKSNNGNGNIKVSFQVECKSALKMPKETTPDVPKSGVIKKKTSLTLPADATVEDALDKSGIKYKAEFGYVSSIKGLSAGVMGLESAWFFCVNDSFPEEAFNSYTLKDGDRIVWRYSVDGGGDIGAMGAMAAGSVQGSVAIRDEEDTILLSGTVSGDGEGPIGDITVTLWKYDNIEGKWENSEVTASDEEGRYSFSALEEGNYRLGYADESGMYLGQFYDGKDDFEEADTIHIEDGIPAEDIDVTLTKAASMLYCL